MNIMICDDERVEVEKLLKIVNSYTQSNPELFINLKSFTNASEMLDEVEKSGVPDIAILDICMPGIKGTEIAKQLKDKSGDNVDIIFLTSSPDFAVEAFSLRAVDYIIKPYTAENVLSSLKRVVDSRKTHSYILIKCENEVVRIDLFDLVYVETKHGILEIHLKDDKLLKTRMTLSAFSEFFKGYEGFNQIGASYFINFRFVKSIRKDLLEMDGNEILPVPRRLKSDLKNQLFEFYKNRQ